MKTHKVRKLRPLVIGLSYLITVISFVLIGFIAGNVNNVHILSPGFATMVDIILGLAAAGISGIFGFVTSLFLSSSRYFKYSLLAYIIPELLFIAWMLIGNIPPYTF